MRTVRCSVRRWGELCSRGDVCPGGLPGGVYLGGVCSWGCLLVGDVCSGGLLRGVCLGVSVKGCLVDTTLVNRMTAQWEGVCPGSVCLRACLSSRMSTQEGLPREVAARGCLPEGCLPRGDVWQTPLCEQND